MQDMLPVERGLNRIDGYGPAGFNVNGTLHETAILLSAETLEAWAPSHAFAAPEPAQFDALLAAEEPPEVLLIGTGNKHEFIAPGFRQALKAKGVSVDSMDTGAACRTYNVLVSEGRRVAALLFLPQ